MRKPTAPPLASIPAVLLDALRDGVEPHRLALAIGIPHHDLTGYAMDGSKTLSSGARVELSKAITWRQVIRGRGRDAAAVGLMVISDPAAFRVRLDLALLLERARRDDMLNGVPRGLRFATIARVERTLRHLDAAALAARVAATPL